MAIDEASWSIEDQKAGYTLPAPFFYDAAVFQREKSKIFFKSWHLVAHVNELREPGTFVTQEIFEQSVIVVAGRDGVLRAFHNVCQHRGNRLVESRRGKSSMLAITPGPTRSMAACAALRTRRAFPASTKRRMD